MRIFFNAIDAGFIAFVTSIESDVGVVAGSDTRVGCHRNHSAFFDESVPSADGAGMIAIERLMGMLLVMLAVQMFINGLATFIRP